CKTGSCFLTSPEHLVEQGKSVSDPTPARCGQSGGVVQFQSRPAEEAIAIAVCWGVGISVTIRSLLRAAPDAALPYTRSARQSCWRKAPARYEPECQEGRRRRARAGHKQKTRKIPA